MYRKNKYRDIDVHVDIDMDGLILSIVSDIHWGSWRISCNGHCSFSLVKITSIENSPKVEAFGHNH
jgi:hypothetical protein